MDFSAILASKGNKTIQNVYVGVDEVKEVRKKERKKERKNKYF